MQSHSMFCCWVLAVFIVSFIEYLHLDLLLTKFINMRVSGPNWLLVKYRVLFSVLSSNMHVSIFYRDN